MKTHAARFGALAVLLLATAGAAHAARYTERFERTFPAADGVEIRLSNTNGSVEVTAWDRDTVEVVAEKSLDSRSRRDAEDVFAELEIVVREGSGRIEIETRQPESSGFFAWLTGRSRNASVRYELRVPRDAELALRTVNGNVATEGATGRQELRSTNGRITAEAAGEAVAAYTTNGSIRVEVAAARGRLEIDLGSTNGSIELALPDGVGAKLSARTVNGSVRSDLPVSLAGTASRKRLSGELASGGPGSVELRTTNGGIRIERTEL